jgi:hypothetical protein
MRLIAEQDQTSNAAIATRRMKATTSMFLLGCDGLAIFSHHSYIHLRYPIILYAPASPNHELPQMSRPNLGLSLFMRQDVAEIGSGISQD